MNGEQESREAFIRFYQENRGFLERYIQRKIDRSSQMEDVLQETFYEAYKRRAMLAEHPNPTGWLVETARRILLAQRRKNREWELDGEMAERIPDGRAELYFERVEFEMLLSAALPERDRELFYLFFLKGYSQRELARLFGLTESSIKNRIYRIRRHLIEYIRRTMQ